jgi:FixJ family two-component response regulator
MSGLELYRRLRRHGDRVPVVFFTEHGDVPTAVAAMREGAFDFLEASTSAQSLLDRVNAALRQDRRARAETTARTAAAARIDQLSPKERTILDLLITGKKSKHIAQELDLARKTVDFHRANILKKTDVDSVAGLAHLCLLAERATPGDPQKPAETTSPLVEPPRR